MPMDAQVGRGRIRAIEHHEVGLEKLAARHDLEAQAEDVATIDSIWIGIANFKRCDGVAYSLGALLDVCFLLGGSAAELPLRRGGGPSGTWFGREGC
jgi:hypothetical protein